MKISRSIRDLYELQFDLNKSLEKRVKELFSESKHENWFYKGRVKSIESFAQKIATGRFTPYALEDFFACTLVVENRNKIREAIKLVENYCSIEYQKPKSNIETHKHPDVFSFDDLRLYVKLKSAGTIPQTPLNDIVFEVQIKTFLQHAWSLATHDLIYKGETISWSKARLAFQIKAMLEHAEISIEQVDAIATSPALALIDPKTNTLKHIIEWLDENWPKELLPKDVVRLGQTIFDLMALLRINLTDIIDAVRKDTADGLGTLITNLSPYEIIVKALSNHNQQALLKFLKQSKLGSKGKIFVTPEMEIDNFLKGAETTKFLDARIKS